MLFYKPNIGFETISELVSFDFMRTDCVLVYMMLNICLIVMC